MHGVSSKVIVFLARAKNQFCKNSTPYSSYSWGLCVGDNTWV